MRRAAFYLLLSVLFTSTYAWSLHSTGSHAQSVALLIRILTNVLAFLLSVFTVQTLYRILKSQKKTHSDRHKQEANDD
ncbi:MAG: hypothetical protein DA330_05790 [Nitrososphaera sp.]|nr:hypothetical protein [Nitrososphaera sp.]